MLTEDTGGSLETGTCGKTPRVREREKTMRKTGHAENPSEQKRRRDGGWCWGGGGTAPRVRFVSAYSSTATLKVAERWSVDAIVRCPEMQEVTGKKVRGPPALCSRRHF